MVMDKRINANQWYNYNEQSGTVLTEPQSNKEHYTKKRNSQ